MHPTLQRSGSAWYRQRVLSLSLYVLAALCGAGVCLCLFLALDDVYLPIYVKVGLVVGMTKQMSDGKEADIVNCYPSKIMSTQRSEFDMIFLGLTIHYVYLLTI